MTDDPNMPFISVILCTHNPRKDYLARTLEALRKQTLSQDTWELVVVDNGSRMPLRAAAERPRDEETKGPGGAENSVDLGWHAGARVVREEELGLTQARLRGIAEAKGELLVFVDDDNLLREDYLEQALGLAKEWPKLGAWSGRVVPEYEVEPAGELKPYLWRLCIREITSDAWGNEGSFDSTPWGAGLCVRRAVAERYGEETRKDVLKAALDRRGESLASTGDVDLALTSLDLGLGTGVFCSLEVLHLIPGRRVQESYLLKLIEDSEAGSMLFSRQKLCGARSKSGIDLLVDRYKQLRGTRLQKAVAAAFERGERRGRKMARELGAADKS
jgi:glycosyltransferase involved in cell wall biosynthesis